MKIAVASDHRGFAVKGKILARLAELGHEGLDFGPESSQSVDYPDYAAKVAAAVSSHQVDRGILICGTGMGMCIVANKFPGIRAAPCHDDLTAEMSRLHNDANVLCLSADLLGDRLGQPHGRDLAQDRVRRRPPRPPAREDRAYTSRSGRAQPSRRESRTRLLIRHAGAAGPCRDRRLDFAFARYSGGAAECMVCIGTADAFTLRSLKKHRTIRPIAICRRAGSWRGNFRGWTSTP